MGKRRGDVGIPDDLIDKLNALNIDELMRVARGAWLVENHKHWADLVMSGVDDTEAAVMVYGDKPRVRRVTVSELRHHPEIRAYMQACFLLQQLNMPIGTPDGSSWTREQWLENIKKNYEEADGARDRLNALVVYGNALGWTRPTPNRTVDAFSTWVAEQQLRRGLVQFEQLSEVTQRQLMERGVVIEGECTVIDPTQEDQETQT